MLAVYVWLDFKFRGSVLVFKVGVNTELTD